MKNNPDIPLLIQGAPIGPITSVNVEGNGFASVGYKVTAAESEYIVLTQKRDCIESSDYAYHFAVLKELERIGYRYAPRAVYINPEHTALVITYVPGQPIYWINESGSEQQKKVIKTLVDALFDLRTADFSACSDTYKELTGENLEATSVKTNVKRCLTDWFELAQRGQPNKELMSWIEPKVALCEAFANRAQPSGKPTLSHGDTSEGNILLTPDLRLSLIDWDTSGFGSSIEGWDDFGIGYLFNHVSLFQKHRAFVIALASEKSGLPADELERRVLKHQELTKLCDVQWAIMMNSRVAAGEIEGDPEKFLQIARSRINDYQEMFAENSCL